MQTSQILSHRFPHVFLGSRDGVAVRVLASHFCGLASIPEPNVTCELIVSLILVFASRFFSPGPSVLLRLLKNQHFKFQFNPSGNGER